jgi:hypothetical protein
MINHAQISEICEFVREMKLEGLTIPQISHRLARQFTPPLGQKGGWGSNHILQIFEYLRDEGKLPENNSKCRSRYREKRRK